MFNSSSTDKVLWQSFLHKLEIKNKNDNKILYYKAMADRLRTASWNNDSHLTMIVKPVYGIPTFPKKN